MEMGGGTAQNLFLENKGWNLASCSRFLSTFIFENENPCNARVFGGQETGFVWHYPWDHDFEYEKLRRFSTA